MKRIIFTIVLVSAVLSLNAQVIGIGLKGGYAGSGLRVENPAGSMRQSFVVGGFAEVGLPLGFSVQADLAYLQAGVISDKLFHTDVQAVIPTYPAGAVFVATKGKVPVENNYIVLPVVLKYDLFAGVKILAGLQYGYLLSSDLGVDKEYVRLELADGTLLNEIPGVPAGTGGAVLAGVEQGFRDQVANTVFTDSDLALVGGIAYEGDAIPFGIEGRINYGFSDINNTPGATDINWQKTISMQVTLSYKIFGK